MPQVRAEDPNDPINQRILELLDQGFSTEDIGREVRRHPDTVAYRIERMKQGGVEGILPWEKRRSRSLSRAWSDPDVRENWQRGLQEASKLESVRDNRIAGGKRRMEREDEAAKLRANIAKAREVKQQKRRQGQVTN